ncbi:MAG: hypothetical protein ACTHNW_12605 [Mucilaginibacter sp.]
MKIKIYKPIIATLCLLAGTICSAQVQPPASPVPPAEPEQPVIANISANDEVVSVKIDGKWLSSQLSNLKGIIASATDEVNDALKDADIEIDGKTAHISINNPHSYNQNNIQQDAASTRTYSKTYPANSDDKLVIDNSYGNVVVNTWDKNYFKVDVQIKASARNAGDEKDMLDDVSISDAKDGSTVAFKTNIDKGKSIWKTIFGGEWGDHKVSINYTVYMPSRNELVIRNRYGNTELPDLSGRVTIESAYGSLRGRSLSGESTIRERYGNIDIGNLGTTAIDLSYGNLSLGSVRSIQANASYSGINIDKLRESGAFNIRYGGGLKIEDMDRDVNRLAVNTTYSSVNVGLSGDENTDFDIVVHYGDFNYHDHAVTITSKSPGDNDRGPHTTKSFKGYVGRGGSGKSISINASYGSVQFD